MTEQKTKIDLLIEQLQKNDFDPDPEISPQLAEIIQYFIVVESLVPVSYAPQLRFMPPYMYPKLRKFIDIWEMEEAKHGEVLRLYLQKHDYYVPPVSKKNLTWSYLYGFIGTILLAWPLWFISVGVYLVIGGANEATTSAGYWALMKRVENYPLLRQIIAAIQAEEVRHLDFYTKTAPSFLGTGLRRRLAEYALKKNWKPIGSRHGDSAKLVNLLLGPDTELSFYTRLRSYLARVDVSMPNVSDFVVDAIQKLKSDPSETI
ncbi:ferritin-like domain-containing protein [bacterium]|nr:MAG: ferritin-like domain-containing protein [bacterium]